MSIIRNILIVAAITMAAQAAMAGRSADVSAPLSERVEKLEQMMGVSAGGSSNDQLSQLQQEIATLRGELEAANHRIEKLASRQQDLYSDLDSRIAELKTKPSSGKTAAAKPYP
jgi:TolA-binding protein